MLQILLWRFEVRVCDISHVCLYAMYLCMDIYVYVIYYSYVRVLMDSL
jgi:hypothetical protein